MATIYTPYIIERSSRGERTYDIFSRLLMDRIIFLGTPINDDVANVVIVGLREAAPGGAGSRGYRQYLRRSSSVPSANRTPCAR